MLSEMRSVIRFALVVAAITGFAHGQDDLQTELRKEFENSARTIRNFYTDSGLKYDAAGNLLGNSYAGPWTIYGRVIIRSVKLQEDKLELDAQRLVMVYDNNQKKLAGSKWEGELLKIQIASPPGEGRRNQVFAALKQVFFNANEDLSRSVPDYWLSYVSGGRNGTCGKNLHPGDPGSHRDSPELQKTDANGPPTKVRVSHTVLEGAKIKDEPPHYPVFAKLAHITGDVVMHATIDTSGSIANLCIQQPAGGGLDEAAVQAVKQWKYRPYMLQGKPVEVETVLTVRFHM